MSKGGTNSVWAWGRSTYLRDLQREERVKLAGLAQRLKSAESPEQKAQIKAEMESVKADFKAKQRSGQRSLFSRT